MYVCMYVRNFLIDLCLDLNENLYITIPVHGGLSQIAIASYIIEIRQSFSKSKRNNNTKKHK